MYSREEVEKANIELSKVLADKYNETEPHYRPENKDIVKAKLRSLQARTDGTSLLDMGCGTGFIIDIADGLFEKWYGVDISEDMISKIQTTDRKSKNVRLCRSSTEEISYISDESIDVVTAYSLLHHLHNIEPTLKEAYRVLKPGGVFWSALDPNYYFNKALANLGREGGYCDIVERERIMLMDRERDKLFLEAEPLKYRNGGFGEGELYNVVSRVGFTRVEIEYYWFLGQRECIVETTEGRELGERGIIIESYLQKILPLSRHLFKYLSITAVK